MKKQLLALAGAAALGLGAIAGNTAPIQSDLTANVGVAIVYLMHPAPGTLLVLAQARMARTLGSRAFLAGNSAPKRGDVDPTAQVGYLISRSKAKAGAGAAGVAQGMGAGAGALLGATVGAKVGALGGPIGSIIGAGIGAY